MVQSNVSRLGMNQVNEIANDKSTHGSMFVPVIAGSDKTTVSITMGHQEYQSVYMSPGNLSNIARQAHGNALLPVAFLPIPKTTKKHRKTSKYQVFCQQMYHACLAQVFMPLKAGMTTPEVTIWSKCGWWLLFKDGALNVMQNPIT
ncbi:hypothetical protein BJV74DRAFT_792317 [Russula compacta]|nr:hypothetical protein BJV74DRAFT_792317 [Russula compacta]